MCWSIFRIFLNIHHTHAGLILPAFTTGVTGCFCSKTSGVDGRPLDGVRSVRVLQDTDFESDGRAIRCTEVRAAPERTATFAAECVALTVRRPCRRPRRCSTSSKLWTAAWRRCWRPAAASRRKSLWLPAAP